MPVIEVKDLKKSYFTPKKDAGVKGSLRALFSNAKTEVQAVKSISLTLEAGEIVGFLGPNGAGKTTTLKMLSGILMPTSGEIKVLGFKPFERKPDFLRQIALVMGNKGQLWWDLPAYDGLVVLKEIFDVPQAEFKRRLERMVEELQISDKLNVQMRKLSLGERMKCELIASLLHNPRVIFLDEPTLGLDVISQKRIREFLVDLNKTEGSTLLLTSHYMQDVEETCSRVIIIDQGDVQFDGSLATLSNNYSNERSIRAVFHTPPPKDELSAYGTVTFPNEFTAIIPVPRDRIAAVAGSLLQKYSVADLAIEEVPIEDVIRRFFAKS